jgi:hypothetical protein
MDSHKKKERVKVHFPGALDSHFSQVLEIREKMEPIDTFRVMDTDGKVLDKSLEPEVTMLCLIVDEKGSVKTWWCRCCSIAMNKCCCCFFT